MNTNIYFQNFQQLNNVSENDMKKKMFGITFKLKTLLVLFTSGSQRWEDDEVTTKGHVSGTILLSGLQLCAGIGAA